MQQKKLKDWIYESGMTVSAFCKFMKISRSTLYRWMNGSFRPTPDHMILLKQISKGAFRSPQDLLE